MKCTGSFPFFAQFASVTVFFFLTLSSCGVVVRSVGEGITNVGNSLKEGRRGSLTEEEKFWAKVAWKYFDNNYNPQTGLVNIKDGFQLSTMACIADYLIALVAAHDFEIISRHEFNGRISTLLSFLNNMPLFNNELPNLNYSANNGWMSNYANQPGELGWSALEIGRLLVVLRIVRDRFIEYGEYIDRAVLRWSFCNIIDSQGQLYSGVRAGDQVQRYPDGNLGWKEYAARGFQSWGFATQRSSSLMPYDEIRIQGIDVMYDGKDERENNGNNALVSLPFLYDGMEFGWENVGFITTDPLYFQQAQAVYNVQRLRYEQEDIFTARTSRTLPVEPYLIHDAIFSNGNKWNTCAEDGTYYPQFSAVSVKAAFGMWVLWKTPYTDKLIMVVNLLFDPDRGWYEARLERSGEVERNITCSTNSMILESLFFKKNGRLYQPIGNSDYFYKIYLRDEFRGFKKCFPARKD